MSTASNDGGPAFPKIVTELKQFHDNGQNEDFYLGNTYSTGGMTLRDWFAGQALAGLLAADLITVESAPIAKSCFVMADAMLAARATPNLNPPKE